MQISSVELRHIFEENHYLNFEGRRKDLLLCFHWFLSENPQKWAADFERNLWWWRWLLHSVSSITATA